MPTAQLPLVGEFTSDPIHSSFQFTVRHMVVSLYRATFNDASASLSIDESGARLKGVAQAASISIDDKNFRAHVVDGADFLDAASHPEITFESDAVTLNPDQTATVEGRLSLRGVEKPVDATGSWEPPVEDPFGKVRAGLRLTASIDRRDWGITWQDPLPKGGDVLAYEIELTIELQLILQQ
jgi:polyisoprenoid-binding protein YceI